MLDDRTADDTAWDEEFAAATAGAFGLNGVPTKLTQEACLLSAPLSGQQVRERLHTICALYAHARTNAQRVKLLDELEAMTRELAALLAMEMLDAGWSPDALAPQRAGG